MTVEPTFPSDIELEKLQRFLFDSIKALEPTRELFAGKKFLEIHLREKGVISTITFINKILDILDDEEGLNLHLDFSEDEISIFNRSSFNIYTRKNFLQTSAWFLSGLIFTGGGLFSQAENVMEYTRIKQPEAPPPQSQTDWVSKTGYFIHKHLAPAGEILCGAGLINEGLEKKIELKLDQVARAITKYADIVQKQYPQIIIQP